MVLLCSRCTILAIDKQDKELILIVVLSKFFLSIDFGILLFKILCKIQNNAGNY